MTAQISDRVTYRDTMYRIAGVSGSGLFDPKQHGVTPRSFSTACWRGYHCEYAVADDALRLRAVYLGLGGEDAQTAELGTGPVLFGKVPSRYKEYGKRMNTHTLEVTREWMSSDYRCNELDELIDFSGGLLIGTDFIHEMYVHMGFHPAHEFRTVHELVFESGQLVKATDCSETMAEFRDMLFDRESRPDQNADSRELRTWIERCFSLDYKM